MPRNHYLFKKKSKTWVSLKLLELPNVFLTAKTLILSIFDSSFVTIFLQKLLCNIQAHNCTTLTVRVRVSPHSCRRLMKEGSLAISEIIAAGASFIYKVKD